MFFLLKYEYFNGLTFEIKTGLFFKASFNRNTLSAAFIDTTIRPKAFGTLFIL